MKLATLIYEAKQKVFVKFIIFTGIVMFLLMLVFYGLQLLPAEKKLLTDKIYDRGATIAGLSAPIIIKSMDTKDDIILLSQIENIMKLDDIVTVYILDPQGTVIAHNKTGEWGKAYTDSISKRGIKSLKDNFFESAEIKGYLYTHPLVSETKTSTLFIGISKQKISDAFSSMMLTAVSMAVPTFFVITILMGFFVSREVTNPLNKFEKLLNSILLGKGNEKIYSCKQGDEIGRIACCLNGLIDKFGVEIADREYNVMKAKERSSTFINEIAKHFESGLIMTDSEDRVIFLNKKGANAISATEKEVIGKHILEFTTNADLIDLTRKSHDNANVLIEEKVKSIDKTVKVVTITGQEHELIGTVIIFA
jgi:methyl-accepting chemotaxis protein